jgi:3-deoxy-D-arabino-heptulosonate 7-phosphate (DAHP) synthase
MAGGQLDPLHPELVLDHQLAAVIGRRVFEEHGHRQVAADAEVGPALDADRALSTCTPNVWPTP